MGKKLILGRLTEKNSHIDHPGFVLHKVNERIVRLLRWDSCHHAQKRAGTLWRPILCYGSAQIGLKKKWRCVDIFLWGKKCKISLEQNYYYVKKYVYYRGFQNINLLIYFFTYLTLMPMNYKYMVLSNLSSLIMEKLAKKNVKKTWHELAKKVTGTIQKFPFLGCIIFGQKPSELVIDLFYKMLLFLFHAEFLMRNIL